MNTQQTDVMQLFVIMATSIFGASVAAVIGPYLLIAFAAVTGAGWSLGRRASQGKLNAVLYFIRIVFTAILLTALIARLVAGYMPQVEVDWLIAPVALIIGLIGDDWLKIFAWLMDVGKRVIQKKVDDKINDKAQDIVEDESSGKSIEKLSDKSSDGSTQNLTRKSEDES